MSYADSSETARQTLLLHLIPNEAPSEYVEIIHFALMVIVGSINSELTNGMSRTGINQALPMLSLGAGLAPRHL